MWRLYDWTCCECLIAHEEPIEFEQGTSPPDTMLLYCHHCAKPRPHSRHRINMVGQYLGDRPNSPMVAGGQFDTAGYKYVPPVPEFNGDSFSDFKDFVNTKSYKETKKERSARKKENKAKKKRASLIRQGANIDIRHHPLPGDPKF